MKEVKRMSKVLSLEGTYALLVSISWEEQRQGHDFSDQT